MPTTEQKIKSWIRLLDEDEQHYEHVRNRVRAYGQAAESALLHCISAPNELVSERARAILQLIRFDSVFAEMQDMLQHFDKYYLSSLLVYLLRIRTSSAERQIVFRSKMDYLISEIWLRIRHKDYQKPAQILHAVLRYLLVDYEVKVRDTPTREISTRCLYVDYLVKTREASRWSMLLLMAAIVEILAIRFDAGVCFSYFRVLVPSQDYMFYALGYKAGGGGADSYVLCDGVHEYAGVKGKDNEDIIIEKVSREQFVAAYLDVLYKKSINETDREVYDTLLRAVVCFNK